MKEVDDEAMIADGGAVYNGGGAAMRAGQGGLLVGVLVCLAGCGG